MGMAQVASALNRMEKTVMSALSDLQEQVTRNASVTQSAVSLIQGLADQLRTAVDDEDDEALEKLATDLAANADALAAAVAANTPAAPEGNPEPPAVVEGEPIG